MTRVSFNWELISASNGTEPSTGVSQSTFEKDTTTAGKVTPDPEDVPDNLGLADIDHFAQFVRGTKASPLDSTLAATTDAIAGEAVFAKLRCNICHVETIITAAAGTVINGGQFSVPEALAGCGKIVRSQQFPGWFKSRGSFRASAT
jgi:hypothetical protein